MLIGICYQSSNWINVVGVYRNHLCEFNWPREKSAIKIWVNQSSGIIGYFGLVTRYSGSSFTKFYIIMDINRALCLAPG